MARMPGTDWIGPTPNMYPGGMIEHLGLVLHIEVSTAAEGDNVDAWFKDPTAQASAHFTNPKTGNLRQLVDTDDAAWTEKAGNRHWVSVEHVGMPGDELTPSQLENDAQLMAWLHTTYNVPLQITDDVNTGGLGWHGMGGDAWGGHFDCPGEPIKAQRQAILDRAREILGGGSQAPAQSAPAAHPSWPGRYLRSLSVMMHGDDVRQWQQRMADRGWRITVDGWYGPASAAVCHAFQVEKGLQADGIVGPATWDAAWTAPIS